MITKSLGDCIAKSIKNKEIEKRVLEKRNKIEKRLLIKEIKAFFMHLPVGQTFEFYDNIVFGGSSNYKMTIVKQTGFIDINARLPIEEWDIVWVRIMHEKLPWFEAELRKRYECVE